MTKETGQPTDSMRKMPKQGRAWQTVRTIFEATTQILEREGEDRLTTNRVAEKAGFSIGTLYQYFPSMDAILLAMIDLRRQMVIAELDALLAEAEISTEPPELFIRRFLRILIKDFGTGSSSMLKRGWRLDHRPTVIMAVRQIAQRIQTALARRDHPDFPPLDEDRLFVVTRSVLGCIRAAVMEETALPGTPAFEDALLCLSLALMRKKT